MGRTSLDALLDSAAHLVIEDGFDAVSVASIASRSGVDSDDVLASYGSLEHLLASMINREYSRMWHDIIVEIERDPRGGLLSSIYRYALTTIYARPLPRALFLADPAALNRIMRASHEFPAIPESRMKPELIARMQDAGMVRPEVDPERLSALLGAVSAGTALTSPLGARADLVNEGLQDLLVRAVDADVVDTTPGKRVFIEYAAGLAATVDAE